MKILHLVFIVFVLAWVVYSIHLLDRQVEDYKRFISLKTEKR